MGDTGYAVGPMSSDDRVAGDSPSRLLPGLGRSWPGWGGGPGGQEGFQISLYEAELLEVDM